VDGLVIATPGSTHAKIALPYVEAGVPTFIEKPMTVSLADAKQLVREAKKSGALIQVGHIHLYNPAYLKLKELLPKIGKLRLINFEGTAPGPVRDDMSVLWDWGPHGVGLAIDLLDRKPTGVQAWGQKILKPRSKFHDAVQARLLFSGGVEATLSLSWLWPEKRGKLTVIGFEGSLVFDDTADNPVFAQGSGGQGKSAGRGKVALHSDNQVTHPRYSKQAPLTLELEEFIRVIRTGKQPWANVSNGFDAVSVLAAAEKSLNFDGKKIEL